MMNGATVSRGLRELEINERLEQSVEGNVRAKREQGVGRRGEVVRNGEGMGSAEQEDLGNGWCGRACWLRECGDRSVCGGEAF